MIYGDLTNKDIVVLEERTAFLFNLAGSVIQGQLKSIDNGVINHRIYKILANVIIDWHWLSAKFYDSYKFNGIGELVWIPHSKSGGIGQVLPARDHKGVQLNHRVFPSVIDLLNSGVYTIYGFREIRKYDDALYLLFPPFIEYKKRVKSRVDLLEQHYWENLVKIYSTSDDNTLDALASCRNKVLSFHSLWIQFVFWKQIVGIFLDKIIQKNGDSSGIKYQEIKDSFSASNSCIERLFIEIGYIRNIKIYIDNISQISNQSELNGFLPCMDEMPKDCGYSQKLEEIIQCSEILRSLNIVCTEYVKILNPIEKDYPDMKRISVELSRIQSVTEIEEEFLDSKLWISRFLNSNSEKEIAASLIQLIDKLFNCFNKRLDIRFEGPSEHYKFFFESYPLPRDHFIRGN